MVEEEVCEDTDCIRVVIVTVIRENVDFLVLELPQFSPCAQFKT
jgi:hypothetical protein